ncbi:glycoside hydrolase family 13 protein [Aliikangiella sp. G2MR2-5]|uniref:glycoside hydrolase family 13 protein n=1 Tax=Aliikangiella sp. G2MR2-5 TaxID=2788943 RepID=UPI0018A9C253|nr:glycoside hydrolase family 13 protein [Aliikangiella sp. G2MR2-5]
MNRNQHYLKRLFVEGLVIPNIWLWVLLFSLSAAAESQSNNVIKVEPPFWWSAMKASNVQLMLSGKNVSRFNPEILSNRIKLVSTEKTDNPDYFFLNLELKDTPPGLYKIELTDGSQKQWIEYELKARKDESERRQGFSARDVIYLVTPDRFANGDVTNDTIDTIDEKIERSNPGARHGGDILGIIQHLDYIKDMGFTKLWVNPVLENNRADYSYHGYGITDLYKVDPRFGSIDDYLALAKKAKQKGIGLIKDLVPNHIGLNHSWMKNLPANDWVNYGKEFKPTNHRREALHDPHAAIEDKEKFVRGWFVPTMPDLNQVNPLVSRYLIQNAIWWVEYADLSGLRIDTFPYSDKNFLSDFTGAILSEYPHLSIVGEEWSLNPSLIAYWQKGTRRHDDYQSSLTSVMDFPLQDALVKALTENESWKDGLRRLYGSLASDFVYPAPMDIMVFADNHDMSRIHTQLGHDVELTKMAMTFILTTRGIPQFFYGSEILMSNPGTDAHGVIRSDFPGGWDGDSVNAFSGENLTKEQSEFQAFIKNLLNWRKQSKAITLGKLTHFAPENGVYTYFRYYQNEIVMVVLNKNEQPIEVYSEDYASVLSKALSKINSGTNVLSKVKVKLNQPIKVKAKSSLVVEIKF